jgi:tryptophan-rich sensory protein
MSYVKLALSIAIPTFIGFIGSLFTSQGLKDWYPTLQKPWFTPPNWLFFPVWTTLFVLMGIAFYLAWQTHFGATNVILYFYFLQLLANFFWSLFFFGMRNPALALVDILVLWVLILVNILLLYRVPHLASYLFIPYLGWVSLATLLNYSIWKRNP